MNGVASSFAAERLARLASFIELEADSLTAVRQLMDVLTETIDATDSILRKGRQATEGGSSSVDPARACCQPPYIQRDNVRGRQSVTL